MESAAPPEPLLKEEFALHPDALFRQLAEETEWDRRMRARLTMNWGVPYNYSGMTYPELPMPAAVAALAEQIQAEVGWLPNNCLANYYPDGESTMGFHVDSLDDLEPGTGIAIVSLGAARVLRFRLIADKTQTWDFTLTPGSLLHMPPEIQTRFKHGVPALPGAGARISLTFRAVVPSAGADAELGTGAPS